MLVGGTEAGDGAYVVGDGDDACAGEVCAGHFGSTLRWTHLAETAGHQVAGQAEPGVVPAVYISHQLVHRG